MRGVLGMVATALWAAGSAAYSQATATATAPLHFSAFGGVTGDFTGIGLAKNLSVTAGVDAGFRSVFGLFPSLEVRGTYPVDKGHVDAQKNVSLPDCSLHDTWDGFSRMGTSWWGAERSTTTRRSPTQPARPCTSKRRRL